MVWEEGGAGRCVCFECCGGGDGDVLIAVHERWVWGSVSGSWRADGGVYKRLEWAGMRG
jgi:hypothetical protein